MGDITWLVYGMRDSLHLGHSYVRPPFPPQGWAGEFGWLGPPLCFILTNVQGGGGLHGTWDSPYK
jgi:hypothetical protein